MTYEMYAPRAPLRKSALRPHYGDDDYIGKKVLDEGADRGKSTRGKRWHCQSHRLTL